MRKRCRRPGYWLERSDQGGAHGVRPEALVRLALGTVVEVRHASRSPPCPELRAQRGRGCVIDRRAVGDHAVVPARGGDCHDTRPGVGEDALGLARERIPVASAALGADADHVPGLEVEDVDLADLALVRRVRVEPRVAGRRRAAAPSTPGPEVIALHGPGRDAGVRREDLDLELDAGAAPELSRPHRIRTEGVALDQERHLAFDGLGGHVSEESPRVVDPVDAVPGGRAPDPPISGWTTLTLFPPVSRSGS